MKTHVKQHEARGRAYLKLMYRCPLLALKLVGVLRNFHMSRREGLFLYLNMKNVHHSACLYGLHGLMKWEHEPEECLKKKTGLGSPKGVCFTISVFKNEECV